MPQQSLKVSGTVGGVSISGSITRSGTGTIGITQTLPAAVAGLLTTRTSDTAGVVTAAGHDFIVADPIDIYFANGRRYNAAVSAVAGDAVTFSAGVGDILPALNAAAQIAHPYIFDVDFVADKVQIMAAQCKKRASFRFMDAASVQLETTQAANEPWFWSKPLPGASGPASPLAGDTISGIVVSHGDIAAQIINIGVLYDSDL